MLTAVPRPASLKRISIERLSASGSAFESLTFPRYRSLLESPKNGIVAFAAAAGLRPVGLALAEFTGPEGEAQLLSLGVAAPDRRQGVGSALLRACEAALADSGCKLMVAYHSSRLSAAPAFEATLRSCGWEASQVREVRSAGRCGAIASGIAQWPGIQRLLRNPSLSFSPWSTVTAADDPAIERLSSEPACGTYMSPKSWTGHIEPRVSIAIRRGSELVGWMLFRLDTTDPEPTLYCETAYIQHDLWRTGILAAGYLHGYRAVAEHFGPHAIVRFFTVPRMPGMMALVRRRFAPVSLWVDDWLFSRKVLNSPSLLCKG